MQKHKNFLIAVDRRSDHRPTRIFANSRHISILLITISRAPFNRSRLCSCCQEVQIHTFEMQWLAKLISVDLFLILKNERANAPSEAFYLDRVECFPSQFF